MINLDIDTFAKKIEPAARAFADKIGTTFDHLYAVGIQATIIKGVWFFTVCGISAIISFIILAAGFRYLKKGMNEMNANSCTDFPETEHGIASVICLVVGGIGMLVTVIAFLAEGGNATLRIFFSRVHAY